MVWRPGHGAALLLRGSQLYGLPRSSPVEPWLTHGLQGDGSVGHVTRGLRSLLSLACDAREAWGGRAPSVLLIAARRVAALWVCGWVLLVARVISYIIYYGDRSCRSAECTVGVRGPYRRGSEVIKCPPSHTALILPNLYGFGHDTARDPARGARVVAELVGAAWVGRIGHSPRLRRTQTFPLGRALVHSSSVAARSRAG